jgi:hypothetical protein
MKFEFNPKIELNELEAKTLDAFFRAVDDACNNANCNECVLHNLCDEYANAPSYLARLFETLGI